MAKLYFRYGAMNCSKTANALMVIHNYEEQGKKVLVFKPSIDIRSANEKIESRIGISHDCIDIDKDFNTFEYLNDQLYMYNEKISCIIVDESQFLTKYQVLQLSQVVDYFNIPVICYGLKNSYVDGELFCGSRALLYYADTIEEIKNVCTYCNKKATMNLRILNGKPIYDGNTVNCGDTKESEDYYVPVCRKHYYKPEIKGNNLTKEERIEMQNDLFYDDEDFIGLFYDYEKINKNTTINLKNSK